MNIDGLNWSSKIDISEFTKSVNEMDKQMKQLIANHKGQSNEIKEFARTAAQAAAGFFSIQAASDFVQSMVQVRGEFQQIEVAYRTMLGSKEKADQLMAESVKLAAVTPFGLQDVASGSKQLLAYGFAAKEITGNLEMLGNVASGVGSQLNDVVYLYGTLKASGRVTQMDINQFAGRGIPIYQALADTMKITTAQVREYVSAGKVGFPDVERAFKSLTGAGGQFFNLMQEQSKTLTGQLSNLSDAWDVMLNELGRQNEGVFATAIGSAITLVENYEKVIDILGALVVGYGTYRAALILTAATTSVLTYATAGFTAAEILHYYWTTTLTKAQKLLNLTMLANPYVAVASALAALGTYLYLASEATDNLTKSQENLTSIQNEAKKSTIEQKQKLEDLLKVARDETKSIGDREAALKKVNAVSPQFLGALTLAKLRTEEGKKAIDDYNKSIDIMALKQASFDKRVELQKQKADLLSGKAEDKLTFLERAEIGLKSGKSGDFANAEYTNAVKEKSKLIDKQLKDISDYEAKAVAEYNTKEPPAIKVLRNVDFLDKEIEELKASQKTVSTRKEHAAIQVQINKLEKEKIAITGESAKVLSKYAKDEQEWQQKRLDFQNKINDAYSNFNIGQLNQNAQEIAQNKAKYDALRKDFKDYNDEAKKEGKSLLGTSELSQINNLESKELYSIKYNQQTRLQAEAFEKQKKLYEDYEDYKTNFGKVEADKRFGNELKTNKQLLSEQSKIVASLSVKSFTGGGLNAGEQARFDQAKKNVEDLQKIQDEAYKQAYEAALTYEQSVERINKEYTDKAVLIRQEATKKGINPDAQIAVLNQKWQAELNVEKEGALKKVEIYKNLNEQIIILTREQIKEQLKSLSSILKDPNVSEEIKADLEKLQTDLQAKLQLGNIGNNINGLNKEKDNVLSKINERKSLKITSPEDEQALKDLYAQLVEIEKKLNIIKKGGAADGSSGGFLSGLKDNKTLTEISKWSGVAADGFNTMAQALGGVDTEAGYTLDTIGQLAGAAGDLAGALVSGDPAKMIGAAIKAVGTLFSIGKKVKEMNAAARKEVEDYYANAIAGERSYIDLLRERELQTVRQNKLVLQGIRDELALRKEQSSAYKSEADEIMAKLQSQSYVSSQSYTHGTWFRKASTNKTYSSLNGKTFAELSQLLAQGKLEEGAKALVERLVELEQKGYDAQQAIADLARETNEFFTGTTSEAIATSIVNGFKEGKRTIVDFGDDFKKIMGDAFTSVFENDVLKPKVDEFYKEFADRAKDGVIDADDETFLKLFYANVLKETSGFVDQYNAIIGSTDKLIDPDVSAFGDKLFSLLTTAADKTGAAVEQILSDYILQALKTEVITNALKPLADKVKDLYKDGKIPTKNEIAEATAEMNLFIENARAQLKTIEEATGLTFAENLKEDLTDAAKAIDNELQSISNSIKDVFANTDGAYENFLVKFDDMVKNKILIDLQTNTLQSKLTDFMTQFNALDKVEDSKKQEQLALLKAEYAKIIREGKEEYDRLQEVFGVDYKPVNTQNQGSISSGIQRITEETANVMVGPILGTYEETKKLASWVAKQYAISTQALEVAIKTEQNTRRGADNTEGIGSKLDEIARNTRPKATGQSTGGIYVKPLT